MESIRLEKTGNLDMTMISNYFIDKYMPYANGEFVKIYIYLLRSVSNTDSDFSLNTIADIFNHTEMDVMRGLKYWEKTGLLTLLYNKDGALSSIRIEDIRTDKYITYTKIEGVSQAEQKKPDVSVNMADFATVDKTENLIKKSDSVSVSNNTVKSSSKTGNGPVPYEISESRLNELISDDNIKELIYIAQAYLGKTLNSSETETILYFYDGLGFSTELIEYLIEYCVSNNHKNMRYIETVAISWSEEHIKTVSEAKEFTGNKSKLYFSVLKSFGITGRNVAPAEKDYITRWTNEYNFSPDIILSACDRTISAIHQPSFQYADSILKSWKSSGVRSVSDIENSDKLHVNTRKKANAVNVPINKPKPSYAANFTQRSYDYNSLERDLLNRR